MAYAAFIQPFVRLYLISVLISHTNQKESSLSAVNCYLSDDLIKTLIVELLSGGTDSYLFSLLGNQFFIEILLKLNDLYFGGRCGKDGLNPKLSVFGSMLFGRKYFSQYIFGVMNFLIFFCFFSLSSFACAYKHGR